MSTQYTVVRPTLSVDRSLAMFGKIQMPDGTIQVVGSDKAYEIIEERVNSRYYEMYDMEKDDSNDAPVQKPIQSESDEQHVRHPEPSGGGNNIPTTESTTVSSPPADPEPLPKPPPPPPEPDGGADDDRPAVPISKPKPKSKSKPKFVRGEITVN